MRFSPRAHLMACAAAVLLPTIAAAQTAPAPTTATADSSSSVAANTQETGADDIVVTAQRRSQRLQDVPVAVSVVGGDTLDRANIKSLPDLSVRIPSVKITTGVLVDYLNIRGVGSGNNAGFEQSVGTFVDGVYRARSRATRAALFDIDQVEILKGPQSTFFGANTVAGALNITTRKPGRDFAYNASGLYGSDNEYNLEGGVTLPLSPDLSVRLAGRLSGMDGFVRLRNSADGPHLRSAQGRIALRYEPTSNFRSDFRFDAGGNNTREAYPFELLNCPPAAPFVTTATTACGRFIAYNNGQPVDSSLNWRSDQTPTRAHYRFLEAAWTNSIDLGGVTLSSITSYFKHRSLDRVNQDPFPIHSPVVDGYDAFPIESDERYHQFAQELRLQSATGGTFEYMIGGYYASSRIDYLRTAGFYFTAFGGIPAVAATGTTASTPIAANTDLHQKDRTLSAFVSATIRPFDGFRINLGGRFTSVRKEAHRSNIWGTAINGMRSTFAPLPAATQPVLSAVVGADNTDFAQPKRNDSKFMPSLGVQYDFSPNVMAYATYSQGFKAGGFNSNSFAISFGPETVKAYEIGMKGQFLDRKLTLNLDAFRSNYADLQETSLIVLPSGVPVSLVGNVAGSRSQGIEGNASLALTRNIRITTDLTYLDAVYTSYPNGACTSVAAVQGCKLQNLTGKRRGFAPEFSGNVGLEITQPIGDLRLSINPLLYFSSSYYQSATADDLLKQSAYSKFDLRVAVGSTDGKWELAFVGKNLTNKLTSSYRQQVTGSAGSFLAVTERGRVLAIQLTIKN